MTKRQMRAEWARWSNALWENMERAFGYPGLAHLEQKMLRSKAEHRCCQCGAPGIVKKAGGNLIQSVTDYWFCKKCESRWGSK